MANFNIPDRVIRLQIASAIQAVVQVSRLSDGTRKVMTISEVTGTDTDSISMQDIFVFEPSIAPEKLLRALLLQALYSARTETNVNGTARLQPAVPLVRGLERG